MFNRCRLTRPKLKQSQCRCTQPQLYSVSIILYLYRVLRFVRSSLKTCTALDAHTRIERHRWHGAVWAMICTCEFPIANISSVVALCRVCDRQYNDIPADRRVSERRSKYGDALKNEKDKSNCKKISRSMSAQTHARTHVHMNADMQIWTIILYFFFIRGMVEMDWQTDK